MDSALSFSYTLRLGTALVVGVTSPLHSRPGFRRRILHRAPPSTSQAVPCNTLVVLKSSPSRAPPGTRPGPIYPAGPRPYTKALPAVQGFCPHAGTIRPLT